MITLLILFGLTTKERLFVHKTELKKNSPSESSKMRQDSAGSINQSPAGALKDFVLPYRAIISWNSVMHLVLLNP